MNILDIIIVIMLISFVYVGYKKGMISELIQITALGTAFLAAAPVGKWIGSLLSANYQINKDLIFFASSLTAYVLIFCIIMITGNIFAPSPVPGTILSAGNKISGGLLGAVKGFLAVTLLILLVRLTPFSSFITENVEYQPHMERDVYDQNVLKNAIAAVKDGAVYLSADSADKTIFKDALQDSLFDPPLDSSVVAAAAVKPKAKAKLGTLAYKLSTTMDPALDSYKKYLFEKVDRMLESAEVTLPAAANVKK